MAERILIVGPAWVGDMVMAQSLYKVIRERHPGVLIDVIAPPATLPLVTRMPEVSRGILFDMGHGELKVTQRRLFGESLRANQYKQAIILPNSLKSALVPFFAEIPIRTGFRGEYRYFLINDMRFLNKKLLPRMIDRFAALGLRESQSLPENIPFPSLTVEEFKQKQLIEQFKIELDRPVLSICPGAEFGDAKKWPEQHFAKLADEAIQRGMQVWIFGGPKDKKTSQTIQALMSLENLNHCLDLTGRTTIPNVVDLMSLSALVVSNDSGLMHIAAAVGCETVVVYGSTSPEFTPPLTEKLSIVSLDLPCSPCFKRDCPLKHKDCLNELKPALLMPMVDKAALSAASRL